MQTCCPDPGTGDRSLLAPINAGVWRAGHGDQSLYVLLWSLLLCRGDGGVAGALSTVIFSLAMQTYSFHKNQTGNAHNFFSAAVSSISATKISILLALF